MQERLQKILSRAGVASRRHAERLIEEGLVTVNGKVAHLGDRADPTRDHVKVRGKLIRMRADEEKVYLLFYKPRGVVTTASEAEERPTVTEFFGRLPARVFPVGRLDVDSEGLLLMTNDGELAHRLMHPRFHVAKRYRVKTKGVPTERALDLLRKGVSLEDGKTAPAEVNLVQTTRTNAWLDVVIREGRYRQIRRMFDKVGYSVLKLKRTGYAFLSGGDLEPGTSRALTPREVERLYALSGAEPPSQAARPKPAPGKSTRGQAATPKGSARRGRPPRTGSKGT